MNASEICQTAAKLVGGPRAAQHGDPTINFTNTAKLWNSYLACKAGLADLPYSITINALDAANMMILLKMARQMTGEHNPDDFVDMAGYAGCAGEIAAARQRQQTARKE